MTLPGHRALLPMLIAGAVWAQFIRPPAQPSKSPSAHGKSKKAAPAAALPVLIDAVAVNQDGQPVLNLTASDFAVSVNREARQIAGVTYVNIQTGSFDAGPAVLSLKLEKPHRTLVLIADDLGLSAGGARSVRTALADFVKAQMPPGDMVSIIRTVGGRGSDEKLSDDRAFLTRAINAISYNPAPGIDMVVHASGARAVLRQVLSGLSDLPGRKAVILFSENPVLFSDPALDSFVDEANNGSAVLSLVDLSEAPSSLSPPATGLVSLAAATGGAYSHSPGDPVRPLGRAAQAELGYYLVGYKLEGASTDAFTGKPLAQRATLTTTRPGVILHARQGVLNGAEFQNDTEEHRWRPIFTTPSSDIQRGFANPFEASAIPIEFAALYSIGKQGPQIEGRVYIDARNLTFTRRLDGQSTCSLDIQMGVFDESGAVIRSEGQTYSLKIAPASMQEALRRGFVAGPKLPLQAVGPYQVRVAVRDATSGRIGAASRFIHAVGPPSQELAISGIALSADSGPDFPQQPNVFLQNHAFKYTYQVLNLLMDDGRHSAIDVHTRILRDGEVIFENPSSVLRFEANATPKVRNVEATVKLGSIQPGHYILEITVADRIAKEARTAVQYVEFEVAEAG